MEKSYSKGNIGKFKTGKIIAEDKNQNKTLDTKVVNIEPKQLYFIHLTLSGSVSI